MNINLNNIINNGWSILRQLLAPSRGKMPEGQKGVVGVLRVIFLFLAFSTTSFAQQAGQIISGTVSDAMGPVMMANVVEIDASNRIVSSTQTDINGNFSF